MLFSYYNLYLQNCKYQNKLRPEFCTVMQNEFGEYCKNLHNAELRTAVAAD